MMMMMIMEAIKSGRQLMIGSEVLQLALLDMLPIRVVHGDDLDGADWAASQPASKRPMVRSSD